MSAEYYDGQRLVIDGVKLSLVYKDLKELLETAHAREMSNGNIGIYYAGHFERYKDQVRSIRESFAFPDEVIVFTCGCEFRIKRNKTYKEVTKEDLEISTYHHPIASEWFASDCPVPP